MGLSVSVADHNLFQQMGIFGAWARFLNLRTPKLAFARIIYFNRLEPEAGVARMGCQAWLTNTGTCTILIL